MNQPKAPAVRASSAAPVRKEPPRSVVIATRLMYAGAAITAIGMAINIIAVITGIDALKTTHPDATIAQLHATKNALILSELFSGVITAGAWVLMARLNLAGLKWARIVATAVFGLATVLLIFGATGGMAVSVFASAAVAWLVGAAATFYLWQRKSSAFFADASEGASAR
ncbi:MAG: hypothetical protein LBV34_08540 [Nocardiopsaceae bacterium]|jgi:hypothetical protein|nr:hypothetical protein [Nocardiopsaceae bacterium]